MSYNPTRRFISADTLIPNPFSIQDFNRYSYVLNNPMKYTDLSVSNRRWIV
jgi:RHS repeat-associated protein